MKRIACALLVGGLLLSTASPAAAEWVRAWEAAPQNPMQKDLPSLPVLAGVQLQQMLRLASGGSRLRIRLSNEFSDEALRLAHVWVESVDELGAALPGTRREVTFAALRSGGIPAHGFALSAPVSIKTAAMSRLRIIIDVTQPVPHPTVHRMARADTIVTLLPGASANADQPGPEGAKPRRVNPGPSAPTTNGMRFFITGVDVDSCSPVKVVVAAGDSITDGAASTPNTDRRWPDVLQRRLYAAKKSVAVVNAGISGNRVLRNVTGPSLLSRLDRDVLDVPGATHVIVLEGINDLGVAVRDGGQPESGPVIAGLEQVVKRAHARGLRVIGGTITPYKGSTYFSDTGERARQEINAWIRTPGNVDGVADFDAAVRDKSDPLVIAQSLHSGDFLHPNDAGYRAMGDAVALSLFD